MKNLLIKSENIKGLNYLLKEKYLKSKIDLVYIDPPFATGGNFTISNDRVSTVSTSKNGNIAYTDIIKGKEFIEFIRERLILLRELLSEQGSIYLHIDYHYCPTKNQENRGSINYITAPYVVCLHLQPQNIT
ncbi:MAG: site-specific DNA-methyltransferase, partial [Sphingobacteriia bacterium]|nr:site-specific DNA-methyltransferase [Sphingobacteriia bacterium]